MIIRKPGSVGRSQKKYKAVKNGAKKLSRLKINKSRAAADKGSRVLKPGITTGFAIILEKIDFEISNIRTNQDFINGIGERYCFYRGPQSRPFLSAFLTAEGVRKINIKIIIDQNNYRSK